MLQTILVAFRLLPFAGRDVRNFKFKNQPDAAPRLASFISFVAKHDAADLLQVAHDRTCDLLMLL
jgi:hypothetical protein